MKHIKLLNRQSKKVSEQLPANACIVDLCQTYDHPTRTCTSYDACNFDYAACCSLSDTCGYDWVG